MIFYLVVWVGIISDACDVDSDCIDAVSESICTSGTCSCLSGYRSNSGGEECIKRMYKTNPPTCLISSISFSSN